MKTLLHIILTVLVLSAVDAQKQECTTRDDGVGVCKPITKCKELLDKAESLRTNTISEELVESIEEELFESRSRCNGTAKDWMVCCNECRTPDGKSGIIKHIRQCKHLWDLLQQKTNTDYLVSSRINANTLDVCCGPPRAVTPKPPLTCDSQIEYPPDPDSKCCGIDLHAGVRITGGKTTGIYAYPWTVLLEHRKDGELTIMCGGSLISSTVVVTAAHCFIDAGLPNMVRVGEFDMQNEGKDCITMPDKEPVCNDGSVSIQIQSFLMHPQYNISTAHNDIALIRMKEPVGYTDFVRPICLPTTDSSVNNDGDFFTVVGWGKMSNNVKESRYKQAVGVAFMDQEACKRAYNQSDRGADYSLLWEKQLCAGGEIGKDSCDGDSGGPLMVETTSGEGFHYSLAGVVSFGPDDCGTIGVPGIYTNVYHYVDWIRDSVRNERLWTKV